MFFENKRKRLVEAVRIQRDKDVNIQALSIAGTEYYDMLITIAQIR